MPYCDAFTADDGVLKLPPVWRTERKKYSGLNDSVWKLLLKKQLGYL